MAEIEDEVPEDSTEAERNEINAVFSCPEPNCTKVYAKHNSLESHILKGKHLYSNNENSFDTVKKIWVDKCISVEREHKVLIQETAENTEVSSLSEGWALKTSKPAKKHSVRVKDYLKDVFNHFEVTGKRPNYESLSDELKTKRDETGAKCFSTEEWLSPSQIRSLFSNFVRKNTTSAQNVVLELVSSKEDEELQQTAAEMEALDHHLNIFAIAQTVTSEIA